MGHVQTSFRMGVEIAAMGNGLLLQLQSPFVKIHGKRSFFQKVLLLL